MQDILLHKRNTFVLFIGNQEITLILFTEKMAQTTLRSFLFFHDAAANKRKIEEFLYKLTRLMGGIINYLHH